MVKEKLVIDDYINSIEIDENGITIFYDLKEDETISWEDERIKQFINQGKAK